MLFSALVLVSINRKHDRLQQRIDFGHGNESAQVCNVAGFGLKQKQQVSILLGLLVVRKESLLQFRRIIEMAGDFILLFLGVIIRVLAARDRAGLPLLAPYGFESAMRCGSPDISHPSRERNSSSIARISWPSVPAMLFGLHNASADSIRPPTEAKNEQLAYLSQGHLQFPSPSPSRTWTGRERSRSTVSTGAWSACHRGMTWCSGGRRARTKRKRMSRLATELGASLSTCLGYAQRWAYKECGCRRAQRWKLAQG